MLQGTFFIYLCIFLLIIVMISVPVMKLLSSSREDGCGKWARLIEERLFWAVPMQMLFVFWLVLAVLSWHNMLRPTQDISTMMSIFNLIAMLAFLVYLYYIFFRALMMSPKYEEVPTQPEIERLQCKQEQRNWIKQNFGIVTKI